MCLLVILAGTGGWSKAAEPAAVVDRLHGGLQEAMRHGEQWTFPQRVEHLRPVVTSSLAVAFMARTSLGGPWRGLSDEEKQAFLDRYAELAVAQYAGRFDRDRGHRFEPADAGEAVGGTVSVTSRFVKADGEVVVFAYKLRQGGDEWKIVDVHVDGVSQLALTRAQYVPVFKRDGFQGLMARLQEEIDDARTDAE